MITRGFRMRHQPPCLLTFTVTLLLVLLLLVNAAPAAIDNWTDGTGNWSVAANWTTPPSTHSVPGSGDTVNIVETDGVNRTITYDYTGAALTLGVLTIDLTNAVGNNTTALSMSANSLSAGTEYVGNSGAGSGGVGTFNQSGGTNTVNSALVLGFDATDKGSYTLSGSAALNVSGSEIVGASGNGTFTQNGGTHTLNTDMQIGQFAGGVGDYNLNGGTFNENFNIGLGQAGTGSFTQTNGNATVGLGLYIGSAAGSIGTYSLSGGTLAVAAFPAAFTSGEYLGNFGTGTFIQSGGTHTIGTPVANQTLFIGNAVASIGTYTLNNAAGTLTVNGTELVGAAATGTSGQGFVSQYGGTVNQSAGNHTVTAYLTIGFVSGSTGNFNLSGGTLNVSTVGAVSTLTEVVGQSGTGYFNQTGGTHTVGTVAANQTMYVGQNTGGIGTYFLNGAAAVFTVNGSEYIGSSATGTTSGATITQYGGTFSLQQGTHNVTGSLTLGYLPQSTSQFFLNGGALNVVTTGATFTHFEYVGEFGTANFTQSGGTHTVGTPSVNSYLSIGDSSGSHGTYTMNADAASLTLNGYLVMGNGAGATGSFNLAAGSVSATILEYIGLAGKATFTQSGGTNLLGSPSSPANMYIASNFGGTGTYTINGPAAAFTIGNGGVYVGGSVAGSGGTGTLNISAGTATINGLLQILTNDSSLNLSGGTLSVQYLNTFGDPTRVNWTGGTFEFQNGMAIDFNSYLGATVNLLPFMTLLVPGAQTLTNNGALKLAGGAVVTGNLTNNATISGFGTITVSGSFGNLGAILQNSGNLDLTLASTAFSNPGLITLTPGFQFQLIASSAANDGTINLNSGNFTGSLLLTNNSDGLIQGPGVLTVSLANFGTLVAPNGTTRTGPFTNNGVIEMASAGGNLAGGAISNAGTIEGFGKISNPVTNNATIEATGGNLIFTGPVTNTAAGTLRANVGTKILMQGAGSFPTNAGLINLTGGTFDNGGQPLSNTGNITGYGTFATGGTGLTNNGAITFTGGTSTINGNLTNAATKTINVKYQPAIFTGNITNNGTIKVTNTTVTFTGTYTGNAYLSDPATNIFQNDVTITPGGLMTGGAGDVFIFMGGTVTNNGTFTNGGTLQSSVNITNTGTFTQSGPQLWSPGTTFTNNGGTANFLSDCGTNAAPPSIAPLNITVNAGTVNFTATTQHLAALTISSGQAIITSNPGAGAYPLTNPNAAIPGTMKLSALSFTSASVGTLDLKNNGLIVEATAASKASLIQQIAIAVNPIANGSAAIEHITSSTAATNPIYGVVVADNADVGLTNFGGIPVDANSILVTQALLGDANLDGVVNPTDLLIWAHNFNNTGSYSVASGDLNNDGVVNPTDLLIWAHNFNNSTAGGVPSFADPGIPSGGGSSLDDGWGLGDGAGSAAVPEPASLFLVGLGAVSLLTRRNRFQS